MFPKNDHKTIKDLRYITIKQLTNLYDKYIKTKQKNFELSNSRLPDKDKQEKVKNDKKMLIPPVEKFQLFLDIINSPYVLCKINVNNELSQKIKPVQEFNSPHELKESVTKEYLKKYGKIFLNRGIKFSKILNEKLFDNYNMYESLLFDTLITETQIKDIINKSNDSVATNLLLKLHNYRIRYDKSYGINITTVKNLENNEKIWDKKRVYVCSIALQEAIEFLKKFIKVTYHSTPKKLLTETLPLFPETLPFSMPMKNKSNDLQMISNTVTDTLVGSEMISIDTLSVTSKDEHGKSNFICI
jgi:hypothetical protein